jgi:hypothetical protein
MLDSWCICCFNGNWWWTIDCHAFLDLCVCSIWTPENFSYKLDLRWWSCCYCFENPKPFPVCSCFFCIVYGCCLHGDCMNYIIAMLFVNSGWNSLVMHVDDELVLIIWWTWVVAAIPCCCDDDVDVHKILLQFLKHECAAILCYALLFEIS